MLFSLRKEEWFGNIRNDILGGLVTSIALIPEVIGFAIIAGINPITALFASVITILVTSVTGGRPGMVSAAAGSMALVMVTLIKNFGIEYMIAATVLTGVIQLTLGYLGIQKFMKFIPKPVMLGFVNALALLIFIAQIQQLGGKNTWTYVMVVVTIIMMYFIPKLTKVIPPALVIIIVMTSLALLLPLGVQTVGDLGDMSGSLPFLSIPSIPFTFETLKIILPTSIALTMVGLIESLLTLPLIDDMTDSVGNSQREVKSQGLANIVTGLFGGQAGCAMIGQAVINVKSGGLKRLSTLTAGISLLFMILFMRDVMVQIPTAALIGIMITVSFATFDWKSFDYVKEVPFTESIVMLVTVGIVVYTHNLAIGIAIGVLMSAVIFMSKLSKIQIIQTGQNIKIIGQLFFASTQSLKECIDGVELDKEVTLDFSGTQVWDDSGVEAVYEVIQQLEAKNIVVYVNGLTTHNLKLENRLKEYI